MKIMYLLPLLLALPCGVARADDADDAEMTALARKSGCLACHAIDKKLVGPAYKDVAAKYAGDAAAPAQLFDKVKKGSKGVWGPIPMPANVTLKDDDVKTLVAWVLTRK